MLLQTKVPKVINIRKYELNHIGYNNLLSWLENPSHMYIGRNMSQALMVQSGRIHILPKDMGYRNAWRNTKLMFVIIPPYGILYLTFMVKYWVAGVKIEIILIILTVTEIY